MKCSLTIIGCFVLFNSMISCSNNNKAAKVECEYLEVDGNHPEAEVEYPAAEEAIVEHRPRVNHWKKFVPIFPKKVLKNALSL